MKKHLVFCVLLLAVSPLFSQTVSLTVLNRKAEHLVSEPVSSGVPFAAGVLNDSDLNKLRLTVGGTEVNAQFDPVARWKDGSVRWLHLHFQADLPQSSSAAASLELNSTPTPFAGLTVSDSAPETLDGEIIVNTGPATYRFQKTELTLAGRGIYANSGGNFRAVPTIAVKSLPDEPISLGGWSIENDGPMLAVVKVEGRWMSEAKKPRNIKKGQAISFLARIFFYRNRSDFRVQLVFRNNNSYGFEPSAGKRIKQIALKSLSWNKKVRGQTQVQLLEGAKKYEFFSGTEKTVLFHFNDSSSAPTLEESRYASDGSLASGYETQGPLALCEPSYYSSTKAWGMITPPKTSLSGGAEIADFDLFERIQRAKVVQADVQNPSTNMPGISLWGQLNYKGKIARKKVDDITSWCEYGSLRWAGNGEGTVSGNHYDWIYGMYLHMMRTGRIEFADAARTFARNEIDFDIYHTTLDGNAFNRQKNWEARPIRNSPGNVFGAGRPTHTWSQGYALHWLISCDPRGKDAFYEIIDGIRLYLYESFNQDGRPDTSEIRLMGWISENLVNAYRIDPSLSFQTSSYGTKSLPDAIKDALHNVFAREAAAGSGGFVYAHTGDAPEYLRTDDLVSPLQHCYFILPAIKVYDEVMRVEDPAYASGQLLPLCRRITDWLIARTFGGDTNPDGLYRPLQIPFEINVPREGLPPLEYSYGTIPYLLMSSDAASFMFSETGNAAYKSYARTAFSNCVRYFGVTTGDLDPDNRSYTDPLLRTPTAYNSAVFGSLDNLGTESKINGWVNRYGQYYLAIED